MFCVSEAVQVGMDGNPGSLCLDQRCLRHRLGLTQVKCLINTAAADSYHCLYYRAGTGNERVVQACHPMEKHGDPVEIPQRVPEEYRVAQPRSAH